MMHGSTNIQWYVLMARVIQNTRGSRPLSHYHTCDGGLLSLNSLACHHVIQLKHVLYAWYSMWHAWERCEILTRF